MQLLPFRRRDIFGQRSFIECQINVTHALNIACGRIIQERVVGAGIATL